MTSVPELRKLLIGIVGFVVLSTVIGCVPPEPTPTPHSSAHGHGPSAHGHRPAIADSRPPHSHRLRGRTGGKPVGGRNRGGFGQGPRHNGED